MSMFQSNPQIPMVTTKRARRRHKGRTRPAALAAAERRNTELVECVSRLQHSLETERMRRFEQLGVPPRKAMELTMRRHMGPDKFVELLMERLAQKLCVEWSDVILAALRKSGIRQVQGRVQDYVLHGYVEPALQRPLSHLASRMEYQATQPFVEEGLILRIDMPPGAVAIKL